MAWPVDTRLERDRFITMATMAALIAVAWVYVGYLALTGMPHDSMNLADSSAGMIRPRLQPWTAVEFLAMFNMWLVMMVGMMLPSAFPMILLYTRVAGSAAAQQKPLASVAWFIAGYLLIWGAFSLVSTLAQGALQWATLLSPMMKIRSNFIGGGVLIAAGLYQWSSLKAVCLGHCRSPLVFIQRHGGFRPGAKGAMALGAYHGLYCIGCCWALMALLFVGGVMNLLWIAALTLLVLAEKILPNGPLIARSSGLLLLLAGAFLSIK